MAVGITSPKILFALLSNNSTMLEAWKYGGKQTSDTDIPINLCEEWPKSF